MLGPQQSKADAQSAFSACQPRSTPRPSRAGAPERIAVAHARQVIEWWGKAGPPRSGSSASAPGADGYLSLSFLSLSLAASLSLSLASLSLAASLSLSLAASLSLSLAASLSLSLAASLSFLA